MNSVLALAVFMTGHYQSETIVPTLLQEDIVQAVYQKYPCVTEFNEVYTQERIELNDQVRDYFYSTSFKVTATSNNEPPHALFINVESAVWAIHGITAEVGLITTTQGDGICN